MKQPLIEQVLEYLVEYVQKQGKIEYKIGQWLYALLVVLDLPLNPDTCSCLRSLARACSVIRANSVIYIFLQYFSFQEKFSTILF